MFLLKENCNGFELWKLFSMIFIYGLASLSIELSVSQISSTWRLLKSPAHTITLPPSKTKHNLISLVTGHIHILEWIWDIWRVTFRDFSVTKLWNLWEIYVNELSVLLLRFHYWFWHSFICGKKNKKTNETLNYYNVGF